MRWFALAVIAFLVAIVETAHEGAQVIQGKPEARTCAELGAAPSQSTWLHLTDCKADVLSSVVRAWRFLPKGEAHEIDTIYLPLRPDSDPSSPVVAILSTNDPALRALLEKMRAVPADASEADVTRLVEAERDTIQRWSRPVDVVGRTDAMDSRGAARARKLLKDVVTAPVPILVPGDPTWTNTAIWAAISVGLAAYLLRRLAQLRQREVPEALAPAEAPQLGELEALRREQEAERRARASANR